MPEKTPKPLEFSLSEKNSDFAFEPYFYPERIEVVRDKELERVGADCDGERVNIKNLKNAEIHITGIATRSKHMVIDAMSQSTKKFDLITNVMKGGGMEVYIKKVKFGDMEQYVRSENVSGLNNNHVGSYTIDLVSTGLDEYSNGGNSGFSTNN
jgi:hypothetical protein